MHEVKSIQELLSQIGRDEILLPEFQRGYVWRPDQVRGLVRSLYRKHPTGHLLVWRTCKPSRVRGGAAAGDGHSLMLLDGQQRLTTLYVLFRGEAPRFYEGEELFFDLYFNVQTEEFRFWQKSLMAKNPAWIGVHEFLSETLNGLLERLPGLDAERREVLQANLARLSRLDQIRNYAYTVDQVTGDDFGVDEVVEIFNRVNRAGTPLTKADLALAHVCSIWPEARAEMRGFQKKMAEQGFDVSFDFLVRCLAAVATGSVLLEGSFVRTPASDLQRAWTEMQAAFEHLVGVLRHDAFIDGLDDLPTHNVLVPATVYLARHEGQFPTDAIKRRFVRWLYLAGLWARYSGATEFKSSLRWDVKEQRVNKQLEKVVVKTLAGFLNAEGGTLLIGVDDAGAAVGLAGDYEALRKRDRDGFEQQLQQVVARDLGESVSPYLTVTFNEIDGQDVCHVSVDPSDHPVYVDEQQQAVFFLRAGNGTRPLPVDEAVKYVQHRWGGAA